MALIKRGHHLDILAMERGHEILEKRHAVPLIFIFHHRRCVLLNHDEKL